MREVAGPQRDVGDVGDPDLVDLRGGRSMEEEIGAIAERVTTIGRLGDERLGLNGREPLHFQEFGDAIDAARLAPGNELYRDSPRAVAPFVAPEDVANQRQQLAIPRRAGRLRLGAPGVIAGAADS